MDKATITAASAAATKYKVPLASLLAVIDVESNGVIFAKVDGKDEPVIRWEGHYFDKRLKGDVRAEARAQGLASPNAGGIKNSSSQQKRWDNLLRPAMRLNKAAAIESTSFGVGQVMGAHWEVLKYASPEALYTASRSGVDGQIDVMMRYVKEFDLIDELQRGDFLGFARGYNGKGQQGYDTRMKKAAKKFASEYSTAREAAKTVDGVPVNNVKRAENAAGMMRLGTSGPKVRELQTLLRRAGFHVECDGDFGPATKEAVQKYQKAAGFEVDGIVGPLTWNGLETYKTDPNEALGETGGAEAIVKTPEGRQGAATAAGGIGVTSIVQSASEKLEPLTGSSSFIDNIYTGIMILGVIIALAGVAWVVRGWWKANSTHGVKA